MANGDIGWHFRGFFLLGHIGGCHALAAMPSALLQSTSAYLLCPSQGRRRRRLDTHTQAEEDLIRGSFLIGVTTVHWIGAGFIYSYHGTAWGIIFT